MGPEGEALALTATVPGGEGAPRGLRGPGAPELPEREADGQQAIPFSAIDTRRSWWLPGPGVPGIVTSRVRKRPYARMGQGFDRRETSGPHTRRLTRISQHFAAQ